MATNDLSKGVAKFISRIQKGLDGPLKDEVAKAAALATAEIIRDRTRAGRGVATDYGSAYRLKPLSAAYIERRRQSRLSPFTSAAKSNLTFSGEMLESLTAKRSMPGTWLVILKGTHSTGISNAQLAKYVSRARPFMFLAGEEAAKVQAVARRTFQGLVKKSFNR